MSPVDLKVPSSAIADKSKAKKTPLLTAVKLRDNITMVDKV